MASNDWHCPRAAWYEKQLIIGKTKPTVPSQAIFAWLPDETRIDRMEKLAIKRMNALNAETSWTESIQNIHV